MEPGGGLLVVTEGGIMYKSSLALRNVLEIELAATRKREDEALYAFR